MKQQEIHCWHRTCFKGWINSWMLASMLFYCRASPLSSVSLQSCNRFTGWHQGLLGNWKSVFSSTSRSHPFKISPHPSKSKQTLEFLRACTHVAPFLPLSVVIFYAPTLLFPFLFISFFIDAPFESCPAVVRASVAQLPTSNNLRELTSVSSTTYFRTPSLRMLQDVVACSVPSVCSLWWIACQAAAKWH